VKISGSFWLGAIVVYSVTEKDERSGISSEGERNGFEHKWDSRIGIDDHCKD